MTDFEPPSGTASSSVPSDQPDSQAKSTDQVLADLFNRFRSREWRSTTPRRRTRGSRSASTGPYPNEEHYSANRVEGIDWSLIEKLEEAEDANRVPSDAPIATTGESANEGLLRKVDSLASDSSNPDTGMIAVESAIRDRCTEKANTYWVPPPGVARSKCGTGPSRFDPKLIGDIAKSEVAKREWHRNIATGTVIGRWDEIVGDVVAQHCPVESFENGKVVVQADSTAWAQQLKLLLPQVMRRIDEVVGQGIVESVVVLPPRAPSWSHGGYRVPGRGPRDTYG